MTRINHSSNIRNIYAHDLNQIRKETDDTSAVCGGLMMLGPIPSVTPHFSDLENILSDYINSASYVLGCVAWLSNPNIIEALKRKSGIKIIINQESHFQEDLLRQTSHIQYIRRQYSTLKNLSKDMLFDDCFLCKSIEPEYLKALEITGAVVSHGIAGCSSLMHNKFLIFLDQTFYPIGVWTGSYNMTMNSNKCLENAVYLTDIWVTRKYLQEFFMILKHSNQILVD
jgi:hypothetical protein